MDGLRVRTCVELSVIINNATLPRVSSRLAPLFRSILEEEADDSKCDFTSRDFFEA